MNTQPGVLIVCSSSPRQISRHAAVRHPVRTQTSPPVYVKKHALDKPSSRPFIDDFSFFFHGGPHLHPDSSSTTFPSFRIFVFSSCWRLCYKSPSFFLLLLGVVVMSSQIVDETERLLAADRDHEENYATLPSSGQSTIVGSQADDEVLDAEDDPLLWPTAFKRSIVGLLAAMAFTVYVLAVLIYALVTIHYAPVTARICYNSSDGMIGRSLVYLSSPSPAPLSPTSPAPPPASPPPSCSSPSGSSGKPPARCSSARSPRPSAGTRS